jgi:hypothetical protein
MKKFLALSALLAVAIGLLLLTSSSGPVGAQSANAGLTYFGPTTLVSGGTNVVTADATNTITAVRADVPRADSIALFISVKPHTSNSVSLTLGFTRSLDGTTYDTANPLLVNCSGTTNTGSGNVVSLATNVPVGAVPYLKLVTLDNNEAIAVATNVTVTYGFKR